MSRSEQEVGESVLGAFLISMIVVGVFMKYWYVVVPLAITGVVLIVFVVRGRAARRQHALDELRSTIHQWLLEIREARGSEHVALLASAVAMLAAGEPPTFVGFQRRLGIARSTADVLMGELEDVGVVNRSVNGRRRSTALSADALEAIAGVARSVSFSP